MKTVQENLEDLFVGVPGVAEAFDKLPDSALMGFMEWIGRIQRDVFYGRETKATENKMTEREKWLLSDASSKGKTSVDVPQYEELRALANKLLTERDRQMNLRMADHAEVVFTGGKW